jgi:hypothetical protein
MDMNSTSNLMVVASLTNDTTLIGENNFGAIMYPMINVYEGLKMFPLWQKVIKAAGYEIP